MTDHAPAHVDCSVLMPARNERSAIEQSVRAMCDQQFEGTLEFLVIDGGSTDGTREIVSRMAAEDPRIRLLDNTGDGTTPASLNIGLRHARGTWVARMDAHTEYPANYVALGVERLKRGGTNWVSGPPLAVGNNPVSRAGALAMKTRVGRGASRKWATAEGEPPREYELDSGVFSGVWRRDVLLEVGGWDERWPRNQDSEMAGRFLARGETLICLSDMASRYTPRGTLGGLWRQYLQYGEYREKTAVRHPHTLRRSHVLLPSLVLATVAAAIAPRPMRTIARAGLGSYVALLGATGILSARDAESATDAALVPVVIAITHFGHGTGFLLGVARNGPPTAALRRLAGATGAELSSSSETVYAPSLTGSTDQSLAVPA